VSVTIAGNLRADDGPITKLGSGTLVLNGTSGDLTVSAGTLAGTGTAGNLTIESTSVLSPGLSIGTMRVDGAATIAGTIRVDMGQGPENMDRLIATEHAELMPGSRLIIQAIENLRDVDSGQYDHFRTVLVARDVVGSFTQTTPAEMPVYSDNHLGHGVFLEGIVLRDGDADARRLDAHLFQAAAGDATGDGRFDQPDIVQILAAGKYRTGQSATWEEGDWNGDGLFDAHDIILALQSGLYLRGPYA
jgi:autotransporter-associated beta strand protein